MYNSEMWLKKSENNSFEHDSNEGEHTRRELTSNFANRLYKTTRNTVIVYNATTGISAMKHRENSLENWSTVLTFPFGGHSNWVSIDVISAILPKIRHIFSAHSSWIKRRHVIKQKPWIPGVNTSTLYTMLRIRYKLVPSQLVISEQGTRSRSMARHPPIIQKFSILS